MLTRRNVLQLGALAGTAALLPAERVMGAVAAAVSPSVPAFSVPLTIPPVLRPRWSLGNTDYYEITMREADAEILPGRTTRIWGYNGIFPGPTIRTRSGRRVIVRQRNDLGIDTAVHLHGGNVPAGSDGHPSDLVRPGRSRSYFYPNRQPATTLWYHDHAHHQEHRNTYRGLTALYLIGDGAEDRLRLPSGRHDIPLMIQDRSFNDDGSFRFPLGADEFAGDTTLVNGRPKPFLEVAQRAYRFRLLNGSSLDGFVDLSLDSGQEFVQIGSDGGLLATPHATSGIPLAPAERADVVVDFSDYPIGSQVVLKNAFTLFGNDPDVLRFDVVRSATEYSRVPATLVPIERLSPASARRTRDFELALNLAKEQFEINGKVFDPNRVDVRPRLGDTEIWRVTNRDTALGIPHTFHTHLVRFQVLDRNGTPPGPAESGWKDTVHVNPGETVRIIMRFGDFTGRYTYHCHLMGHSTAGMMAQMEVVR